MTKIFSTNYTWNMKEGLESCNTTKARSIGLNFSCNVVTMQSIMINWNISNTHPLWLPLALLALPLPPRPLFPPRPGTFLAASACAIISTESNIMTEGGHTRVILISTYTDLLIIINVKFYWESKVTKITTTVHKLQWPLHSNIS